MAQIQIVYGSNSGNTKMVCEYIAAFLSEHGHLVKIDRCEHYPEDKLSGHDLLILGCSTYEHGALEDHFRYSFWPRIQDIDLAGQKAAVVGLGDSKYDTDYNIESGRILAKYIEEHNGELVHENLMINKCPLSQLEHKVKIWVEDLNKKI
ncbi:flavodoxin family protein [bacterium]|nr:flavodoxin family protein [bacterium]NCQ54879.1 flavodoxin family protein [Candidatus Parcubacteria bacterium]NCS66923.1 flavodoxin family protein [Candidatus Peregrinibacteria bacterium]NCS95869.1 flavodoxin family protein [bacterium]